MTPPQAQPVSTERPLAGSAVAAAAAGAEGPFVVNLRSSTTPMALSQPNDPALARFKFFMSRRLEDGRERFRLHMGFFESLAEAEEWLAVVREIYPGAWAGEAPGKRLKARAAEPAAAASAAAPAAPVSSPPAAAARTAPAPRAADSQPARRQAAAATVNQHSAPVRAAPTHTAPAIPRNVPVLQPAPAHASAGSPAVSRGGSRTTTAAAGARRPAETGPRATAARDSRPPAAHPQPAAGSRSAPSSAKAVANSKSKAGAARLPLSNVREVLAALDETGATRQMPALPVAKSAPKPGRPAQPETPPQPRTDSNLSDTQVLKLLEGRRADGIPAEVDRGISLLKPDDSGTRRALKEAVETNAPVSFAVQLQWSVQSIDITKVPPLAIFSAYTLYTVEGSREGRRWYGLRLGFFSDAISAKQVAHYVRSEFNSVAVVPVSSEERGRASDGNKSATHGAKPAKSPLRDRLPEPTAEFKLLDDVPVERIVPAAAAKPAASPAAAAPRAAAESPTFEAPAARPSGPAKPKGSSAAPAAKKGPRTPAGRVRARDKRSAQTLEETLEILGADQLEIDQGSGETLNDTGVRHLKVQVRKETPFTRLLDRLSERARGR